MKYIFYKKVRNIRVVWIFASLCGGSCVLAAGIEVVHGYEE